MSREVYVINGYPGCGKTTFGQMAGDRLSHNGINFIHTSSIDPIKHILRPQNTWDPDVISPELWTEVDSIKRQVATQDWDGRTKDVYWRGKMSDLKLSLQESLPSLVHDFVLRRIAALPEPSVGFVDIREPWNIEGFKTHCSHNFPGLPVQAVFVESDKIDQFNNVSDASVENYPYDITIDNRRLPDNSLIKLHQQVARFCEPIIARATLLPKQQ